MDDLECVYRVLCDRTVTNERVSVYTTTALPKRVSAREQHRGGGVGRHHEVVTYRTRVAGNLRGEHALHVLSHRRGVLAYVQGSSNSIAPLFRSSLDMRAAPTAVYNTTRAL